MKKIEFKFFNTKKLNKGILMWNWWLFSVSGFKTQQWNCFQKKLLYVTEKSSCNFKKDMKTQILAHSFSSLHTPSPQLPQFLRQVPRAPRNTLLKNQYSEYIISDVKVWWESPHCQEKHVNLKKKIITLFIVTSWRTRNGFNITVYAKISGVGTFDLLS